LQRFALQNFAHKNICNELHTLGLAAHPSTNLIISEQNKHMQTKMETKECNII
jgi:hypothetical protein